MLPVRPSKRAWKIASRSLLPLTSSGAAPAANKSPTPTSTAVTASNQKEYHMEAVNVSRSLNQVVSICELAGIPAASNFSRVRPVQKLWKSIDADRAPCQLGTNASQPSMTPCKPAQSYASEPFAHNASAGFPMLARCQFARSFTTRSNSLRMPSTTDSDVNTTECSLKRPTSWNARTSGAAMSWGFTGNTKMRGKGLCAAMRFATVSMRA
mmetsp:Transcript_33614/g.110020  ORF Transcript_33614/g.110020 Transcript_33614/m.110020 type:complete len:211 (-) Transcript_33614:765-1397(-)